MQFLEKALIDKGTIAKLQEIYDKAILSSIVYREDEVLKIIEYLKELGFDIKTLLVNRLDIFLLDLDYLKRKIGSNQEIIETLKNDFSFFDELL